MEILEQLAAKLQYLKGDGKIDLLIDALNENETLVEDLNLAQLKEGQKADGKSLPNYSIVSVVKYGKPAGAIRLYDKGGFYRGWEIIEIDREGFEMRSSDYKTDMLAGRYGEEIFGLTDASENKAGQYFIPSMQKSFLNLMTDES